MNNETNTSRKRNTPDMSALVNSLDVETIPGAITNNAIKAPPKRTPITPPNMPNLPLMALFCGVCKSGKTVAMINLLMGYINKGIINLVYCISPTYDSNASLQTVPFVDETKSVKDGGGGKVAKKGYRGIYTDPDTCIQDINSILAHIKKKQGEWEFEEKYKEAYRKWRATKDNMGTLAMTADEYTMLSNEGYRPSKDIPWPVPAIFIDDMTHTDIASDSKKNPFNNLSLKYRHIHSLGVTIVAAYQTFKTGMPRVVRKNLSMVCLFATTNLDEIEALYKEIGNNVTFETFKAMFFKATELPFGFLMIDKWANDDKRQYHINFDKVFVIDPVEERRKILCG